MRFYLIIICLLSLSTGLMAQVENIDCGDAVQQCNHARGVSSTQNINYYQYPSLDKYDLKYLKLDLSAETGSRFISGTAYTESIALAPMDSFITEFKNAMTVDSVFVNGSKLSFNHSNDHIFIPLSPTIGIGSPIQTLIYYKGTASSAGVFTGTTGSLNYTATLSESYQAREWFPIKQKLYDKIDSADIWITTSAINKAGSNGLLVDSVDLPAGKKQYRWKTHYPMDYYLVSFAIGNYMEYDNYAKPASIAPDSILIQHYIMDDPSYLTAVKTNLDKTPSFIEKMSELYGLYPFSDEKYGHCLAQIGGGMEHQTMTTLNGFGSTLIAHELAHQWWGDHVTCVTWNDIWLNEGFASYGEYLMIEKLPALFSTTPAPFMQNIHNNVMSLPGGSVYVPDASVFDESRIFSGRLTYNKGSAIIHNLRFEMEDDNLFFQTLQDFQQQYGGSVASATDFKMVAQATSGKNFNDFFDQWYYGEGYPTFNITYFTQGNDTIILLVNETVSAPSVTPFFKGLFEFKITSPQGDTTVKVNLTANDQQFKFPYGKTPDGIIVDPSNWVLNQTGTITDGGTVPIHVFDFENSTDAECNTTFKWKSTNELPGTRYDLEYSTDATTYSTLASLPGTAHPVSIYQYRALLNLEGLVYIRVKITEPGGRFYYSDVSSFQLNCHLPYSVSLTPNPVINTLTVSVRQPLGGKSEFSLVNEAGQLLYRSDKSLSPGISMVTIDMKAFSKGTYFLKIRSADGSSVTKRLVKL